MAVLVARIPVVFTVAVVAVIAASIIAIIAAIIVINLTAIIAAIIVARVTAIIPSSIGIEIAVTVIARVGIPHPSRPRTTGTKRYCQAADNDTVQLPQSHCRGVQGHTHTQPGQRPGFPH